jgi:TolB-like protein/DNA-binding winged helix-turn-helix (wHTH) protein/Tfp pilus assembly protein PilF
MAQPAKAWYEFGPFRLDAVQHLLFRNGQLVSLAPKAVETLVVLVENHGRLVEKENLMKAVWPDTFVEEANLSVHISALRKVFQDQASANGGPYVETVPRRGYRFVATVVERSEADSQRAGPTPDEPPHPATRSPRARLPLVIGVSCLVALLYMGLAIRRRQAQTSGAASPEIHSLAVLPLQNLSGDPSQEYLADGLTEALVTDLAQLRALRVISRTSSMRYKDTQKSLPEIARELNVDGIVEGSVLRSGERVRITVQLIQAGKDEHIWANTYEGDLRDILGLQNVAAREVAQEIRVRLTPEEAQRLVNVRLIDPVAHEAYLKGRYVLNQRTPESTKKSVAYFQQAVRQDPQYASAYLALGEAYALLATNVIAAPQGSVPKARKAAQRALELDPGLGEAYGTLAFLEFFYDWDFPGSEQQFRRAIELSPNYATAHQWYGLLLMAEKRFDEAAHEFATALEIDPLSLMTSADLGQVYFYSGRFDQTIEQTRKILEINPDFAPAHDLQAMAYEQKGMYKEAMVEFQKYSELSGGGFDSKMHLAHFYAVTGKHDEARKLLDELENPPSGEFVSPYDVASVYAGLGEKDKALHWLDRAHNERAAMIPFAGIDPLLNPLRGDPRFEDLLRRVGVPP